MSEGIGRLNSELDAAVLVGDGDWQEIRAVLAAMPDDEMSGVLERLAGDHGVAAVPVLEQLAAESGGPAIGAVQALSSVADVAAASALERIAATSSADLRKAARRSLHRLASKGIAPAAAPEAAGAEARLPRIGSIYKALASPIDGAGNRGIWFAFDRGGELDIVSLLLNDEQGIKDVFVRDFSIARFERDSKRFLENREFPWIEMPPDYCRHLVDLAHRLNASSGTPLPVEFLAWRDQVGKAEASYEQPIIYTVVSAAEVRWEPRYLDNSDNLFNLDLFKGWILDKDELREFIQEKLSVERSGLVLPSVSGEAQDRMIDERAILTLFDARRRAIYKRRLDEMAYLLWKLGRLEAARQALAAALALEPADRPLSGHPFVVTLVQWSMEVASEMARGERTRHVKPGVQLHLPY